MPFFGRSPHVKLRPAKHNFGVLVFGLPLSSQPRFRFCPFPIRSPRIWRDVQLEPDKSRAEAESTKKKEVVKSRKREASEEPKKKSSTRKKKELWGKNGETNLRKIRAFIGDQLLGEPGQK